VKIWTKLLTPKELLNLKPTSSPHNKKPHTPPANHDYGGRQRGHGN